MRKRGLIIVLLIAAAVFAGHWLSYAQDAEPGPPPDMEIAAPPAAPGVAPVAGNEKEDKPADVNYLKVVLQNSGIPGWIVILLSFVSITLWFKFGFQLRRDKVMPIEMIGELDEYLKEKKIKEAVDLCRESDNVLSRIVGEALAEIRGGHSEMAKVVEEVTEEESIKMHQELSWLSLIASIAPMLGLLGTVIGMVGAFAEISASGGQPKPADLASNIQLALITTVEGLTVAVPTLVAYAIFRNRVVRLVLETGVAATSLISRFKNVKITPAMATAGERTPGPKPKIAPSAAMGKDVKQPSASPSQKPPVPPEGPKPPPPPPPAQ